MACMCGDICCPSCGPAQGNHHCPICGNWSSDGGCDSPDGCNEKLEAYAAAEAEAIREEYGEPT